MSSGAQFCVMPARAQSHLAGLPLRFGCSLSNLPHWERAAEKTMTIKGILSSSILALLAAAAHAGQPVASITCTGNQGSLSLNLSYFSIGTNSPNTGAGAGNGFSPLTLHSALGSFDTLFQASANGANLGTCTLTTQASNGGTVQFTLRSVTVVSVTAIAGSPTSSHPRTAYVNAALNYGNISLVTSGGSGDDGGTSPVTGWDVTTNKDV